MSLSQAGHLRAGPRVTFEGVDADELTRVVARGRDHGDNRVQPFLDVDGGWPLRCCFEESSVGDRLAIICWSPYRWAGPYREMGPIVVHVDGCPGLRDSSQLAPALNRRPYALRPYGPAHTILYDRVRHVEADHDVTHVVTEMLLDEEVAEVYAKNHVGGCFAFVARRATAHS